MSLDPAQRIRLDGRTYAVTGAGGGIGQGIVERLRAAGAHVVAQYRSRRLQAADGVETVSVDLRDLDAPSRIVDAAIGRFGRLDGLINNAGVQPVRQFDQITDEQWTEMLDVNLTAAHRLTQAAARTMAESSAPGSIVHIASIEARQPTTLHGHYATSKAALVMHAKAAALAYGPAGIRVNVILPGLIDRPGLAEDWPDGVERWSAKVPLGRLGTADDIGDACVFLCSDMASWVSGAELVVDGGMLTNPTW
jgi:NAD(P)-dependent dehydrogenase (short-subunit alcohol dehydrogenase family)